MNLKEQQAYADDLNKRLKAAGHRPLLSTRCKCLKCVTCGGCSVCESSAGCPDCTPGKPWENS